MLPVAVVGLPFYEIKERPLETLVGIRVQTWALFSLLGRYGFDASLFVESSANIDSEIEQTYGNKFIRSQADFLQMCERGDFSYVIFCSTKLEYLLKCQPWLRALQDVNILGTFCYDNNSELDNSVVKQMVGTTFNNSLQKIKWDMRKTDVPSFVVPVGQVEQYSDATESRPEAIFVGELRSLKAFHLLCDVASLLPKVKFHIVVPRIIEQANNNHIYIDFSDLTDVQRPTAFSDFIKSLGRERPTNLIYHYIPHGYDNDLLDTVSIGLDFSWHLNHTIENSKLARYLTFGLSPVVQEPAPSARYLNYFGIGSALHYDAPADVWAKSIEEALSHNVAEKNMLRMQASDYFSWNHVVFEIASYLIAYEQNRRAPLPCTKKKSFMSILRGLGK